MPDGPMGTTVGQQWTGTQAATHWHHSPFALLPGLQE